MANPIIEIIARNIETKINEITQANGFNEDLSAIRPKVLDFAITTPADRVVLIVQDDEEKPPEQGFGAIQWSQGFAIMAFVINSESSSEALDIRRNRIRADIQKKLTEDITRGGYAFDTELVESTYFDDGASFSGVLININVKYRVKEDDPYTIG